MSDYDDWKSHQDPNWRPKPDPRPLEEAAAAIEKIIQALIDKAVLEARIDELQWVKSLYPDDLLKLNSWAMEEEIIARIKELKETE